MIEKYIEKIKDMEPSRGSNKRCYSFDDVVLLTGSFVNDQKENKIKKVKLDILKQNGVNVCRVLEYAVINNQEYELQEKAKGEELYNFRLAYTPEGREKYLNTLNSLSNQDIDFFKKFLEDWHKILLTGLDVDPSKSGNFFYDGNNICFIDLNLTNNYAKRVSYMYREAAVVLRGGGLLWQAKEVYNEANEYIKIIYKKLGIAILELGNDIEEYISFLDPNGEDGLREFFDEYKSRTNKK